MLIAQCAANMWLLSPVGGLSVFLPSPGRLCRSDHQFEGLSSHQQFHDMGWNYMLLKSLSYNCKSSRQLFLVQKLLQWSCLVAVMEECWQPGSGAPSLSAWRKTGFDFIQCDTVSLSHGTLFPAPTFVCSRTKFPHIVAGAIAASAPIAQFRFMATLIIINS